MRAKALDLFRLALFGVLTIAIGQGVLIEIENHRLLTRDGVTV